MNSTTETAPNAVRTNCAGGNPSEAVVLAVAEAKDADPLELEPLNSIIDADALNNLFSGESSSIGELHFSMADCDIVVHGGGDIVVTPPPTTADASAAATLHEN